MPEPAIALMAGNSLLQGLMGYGQAKAQHEVQMAAYRRDLLQSWLDLDRQNFSAATSNARQIVNLENVGKQASKWKGRSHAQLKENLAGLYRGLSQGYNIEQGRTRSSIASRNAQGGSSEAILRVQRSNAEEQVRQASLQNGLQARKIDEQYEQMLNSATLELTGASSFIEGSAPTDNSASAFVGGLIGGLQSGANMAITAGNLNIPGFRP